MFKKPVKIGAQNQLSGKDKKMMKNKLITIFDEACVEKLLAVNDKIISCKVTGSKMMIYNGNDYPILVDGTGKNDFFPSLYTCQAYQPFLKSLTLNQGVESYIFNGANLMWPGVNSYEELENFAKDQVVGIKSLKGETIAVGAMGCSRQEYQSNKQGSGVAVYILHYKSDKLWDLGPKTNPEVLVQSKKQPKKQEPAVVVQEEQVKKQKKKEEKESNKNKKKEATPEKKKQQSEKEESSEEEADFLNIVHSKKPNKQPEVKVEKKANVFSDEENEKKGKKKNQVKKEKQKKEVIEKKKVNKKSFDQEEQNEEQGSGEEAEGEGEEKKEEKPKSVISAKLMDQYLKECFLNAIKLSKVEGELPIDSGRFYIDYMLLARPEGIKLQIKDSTYKKLGKFYEDMAKQKFIEFKHSKDKKGQQGSTITKIMWENNELKNYEPTIFKMNQKEVEQKEVVGSSKKLNLSSKIEVDTAYKPSKELKEALFKKTVNYAPTEQQEIQMKKQEEAIANEPEYYTENQIRALIEKYINQVAQGKSKDNKVDKMVIINYQANPFLNELLKKEIEDFQENSASRELGDDSEEEAEEKKKKGKKVPVFKIDRGNLVNKILKKCSVSYRIVDQESGVDAFKQGTFKGIQITAEKANNKNITKLIGLETFIVPKSETEEQLNWFCNMLQQKFACSVNLINLPGKVNPGKQIIVHGNFLIELEEMFTTEYKINKDYITTQNKLNKKKKN